MPSSRPVAIPTVIHLIKQLRPMSILDVGVGFGKWGHLFREYTDIIASERDPVRYQKRNWKVRIDGVEGFSEYLTEMHRYIYDSIYEGNALELLPNLPDYDVIFLGDVIEHFEMESGRAFLTNAIEKANKAVIVSTPKYETHQADICANDLERHRSIWTAEDFLAMPGGQVRTIEQSLLLAVVAKNCVGLLNMSPEVAGLPKDQKRRKARSSTRAGRDQIRRAIGRLARMIR